jgi:phosphatidyl-myo-inositol dimannoside synthase
MRLLIVSSEFPPGPGGIGTHAFCLASNLMKLGWKVSVVTSQDYANEDEIRSFNASQPFPIVRFNSIPFAPFEALYRWRVLARWARAWEPDVLMATGDRAVLLVSAFARSRKLPCLAVGHGTEFNLPRSWERALVRRAFTQAAAIACVSRYTRAQMIGAGVRPKHEAVIQNGADANLFTMLPASAVNRVRKSLGIGDGHVLLTVGSVTERKGQDIVIRALPHILKRVGNVHYLVAGMPVRAAEFMQLAQDLKVADHVHFLGRVTSEKLVQLLNCCDVFVMTSKRTVDGDFEGYGIAVIEAALCGKPAVVSNCSGLAEAISEGITGLGVPEGDEVATANAILTLLEDDQRTRKMGETARQNALAQSTWEHKAREYDLLLQQVLQREQAAAPKGFPEVAESVRS